MTTVAEQGTAAPGRLVVVAAPDEGAAPSPRAVEVLGAAALVGWEDTPRATRLLEHVPVPAARRHRVDSGTDADDLVARMVAGAVVALVTDAGAPGVAEPAARLVAAAVAAGLLVEVVPAPVPAVAALVASGLATDQVAVEVPLPAAGPAREARLAELAGERRTTARPERADRVAATLAEVAAACGPDRPVAVRGDLGPPDGDIWRGTAAAAASWAAGREMPAEVVLVVGGTAAPAEQEHHDDEAVRAALRAARARGLSPGRAAAEVAAALGRPRREVYALGAEDET